MVGTGFALFADNYWDPDSSSSNGSLKSSNDSSNGHSKSSGQSSALSKKNRGGSNKTSISARAGPPKKNESSIDQTFNTIDVVIIHQDEKSTTKSPAATRLASMQDAQDGQYVQNAEILYMTDGDQVLDLLSLVNDAQLDHYKNLTGDTNLDRLQLTPMFQMTNITTGRNALFMFKNEENDFCTFVDGAELTMKILRSNEAFLKSKRILYLKLFEIAGTGVALHYFDFFLIVH